MLPVGCFLFVWVFGFESKGNDSRRANVPTSCVSSTSHHPWFQSPLRFHDEEADDHWDWRQSS